MDDLRKRITRKSMIPTDTRTQRFSTAAMRGKSKKDSFRVHLTLKNNKKKYTDFYTYKWNQVLS